MKIAPKSLLTLDRLFRLPHWMATALFASRRLKSGDAGPSMVIKLMGLGSIIKFAALCKETGVDKKNIILLTFDQHHELGPLFGFVHVVMIRTDNFFLFLNDCWKVFAEMRALNVSRIIDFERCSHSVSLFSSLLAMRAKCKKVSFERRKTNLLSPTEDIFDIQRLSHEGMLLQGIAYLSKTERAVRTSTIDVKANKVLININASAYLLARRYPAAEFREMIRLLNNWNPGLEFYCTGSKNEMVYVENLVRELCGLKINAINVAGKWSLSQLARELSDAAAFVTGDSGPLHLAAYLDVPVLAIWGPTQAAHFGYHQRESIHNVSLELTCSPCFIDPASRPAIACQGRIDCMKISPASLAERTKILVSQTRSKREVSLPSGLLSDNSTVALAS